MLVTFTASAQVQGAAFHRGQIAELADDVAEAYIQAGQCQPHDSRSENDDGDPQSDLPRAADPQNDDPQNDDKPKSAAEKKKAAEAKRRKAAADKKRAAK